MSQNPYLSSNPRYGFLAPPSFSISPAHTLQLIGFGRSAPRTRPNETSRRAISVSTVMSRGSAALGEEVRDRALL